MTTQPLVISMPDDGEFTKMMAIAKATVGSQMYPKAGNESAVFMKLLAAREMRLPFITALNGGIHCFDGKMEISPRLLNGMIKSHGHKIETLRENSTECVLRGTRADNGQTEEHGFTIEEARVAGLLNKDNWKKYPKDMLYARALSRLSRRLFPDVIGTSYVEGEVLEVPANPAPSFVPQDLNSNICIGQPGVCGFASTAPLNPTLSSEQAHSLQGNLLRCSLDFQERFKKQCLEKFNITDLALLPIERFSKMMTVIENNILAPDTVEISNAGS